ncbi:ethylene-responsive transcription factor 5-like [Hibiscus syriacus]|uniref:peroxidase n=1 Tax=Hibiscus syriacus TaxID=106335 RepID=A0A6A3C6C3_HIBSY|nr:ethylene-responsive transcription factor 5-like [Hibiscus syriacus]
MSSLRSPLSTVLAHAVEAVECFDFAIFGFSSRSRRRFWRATYKCSVGAARFVALPSYRLADVLLPPATTGVADMLNIFSKKRMTLAESVAILGAHMLGISHCSNIQKRLYGHKNGELRAMEPAFAAFLRLTCWDGSLASSLSFVLNDPTPFGFDNQYYVNAMRGRGLLRIDAEMVSDPRTGRLMQHFAMNEGDFFRAFSSTFVKLSAYGVLTGKQSVIRKNCYEIRRLEFVIGFLIYI